MLGSTTLKLSLGNSVLANIDGFVDNLNKEIWPILSGEESTSFGYNFRTTDLQFNQQLN